MKVVLAKHAGFCFGVKRAVNRALALAEQGERVVTLGDLIHNKQFVAHLAQNGIRSVEEICEAEQAGCKVLIRSHGVPPAAYEELERRKIPYEDLTCPFVERIHRRVHEAQGKYEHILIVGKENHPEVVGIRGWAGDKAIVVNSAEEAEALPPLGSVLVVAQTTITRELFDTVCRIAAQKAEQCTVFDSICETTVLRQKEAEQLARSSDAMLVIGDRESSNSRKLYEIAKKYCKKAYFIEDAAEVVLENLAECDIIGISAGASAPDWIIREVCTLMELEKTQVTEETAAVEAEAAQVAEEVVEAAPVAEEVVETAPAAEEAETAQPAEEEKEAEAAQPVGEETEEADFAEEMEKTFVKIRRGQFVKGVVVHVTDEEVCVNIGYKADGLIKKVDLTLAGDVAPSDLFKAGDEIEAEVISLNDGVGNVVLSRKKIENQVKWREFVDSLDMDAIYECVVSHTIKGGVLTKFNGYEAFIPASQLSLKYVEDLSVFVGQTLLVKIIDVDKRQKRFVLSNKEALKQQIAEQEKMIFESFEKGSVVRGVVKRLTDFGAFVDVGGVDGLLHITDISWVRIKHPKDVLSENQEIDVKILNVDPEKKRISLGYKQLQPKPWDLVPEKYLVGETVTGKVVRIAPFGAFVELEPTVDGLVHISQVTNRRIEKVEDVLSLGQEVTAKILEVNSEKKRISLSIRALIQPEKRENAEEEGEEQTERKPRARKEDRSFVIPPREEATTSLADLFKMAEEAGEEKED